MPIPCHVPACVGLPSLHGLDDPPCFKRSYVLLCEHHYHGNVTWLSGDNPAPIHPNDNRYTMNSKTLEIHNTSDVIDNSEKIRREYFTCRVILLSGTFVTGNKFTLKPLGEYFNNESM